jgi:hypothetical protein
MMPRDDGADDAAEGAETYNYDAAEGAETYNYARHSYMHQFPTPGSMWPETYKWHHASYMHQFPTPGLKGL